MVKTICKSAGKITPSMGCTAATMTNSITAGKNPVSIKEEWIHMHVHALNLESITEELRSHNSLEPITGLQGQNSLGSTV